MPKGQKINGIVYKENGEDFTWDDMVNMFEAHGVYFGGFSQPVNEEGEPVQKKEEIANEEHN